jgi:hypothetical protein
MFSTLLAVIFPSWINASLNGLKEGAIVDVSKVQYRMPILTIIDE